MKELIRLLLEMLACSGILLGLYTLLLDRRVRFGWCRAALLALPVLSAAIPLLRIPVWPGGVIELAPTAAAPLPVTEWSGEAVTAAAATVDPWAAGCTAIYLLGVALLAGAMAAQLLHIRRLRRGAATTRTNAYTLIRTPERIAAFSFFGNIYIWDQLSREELEAVVAHESSHIRHRHSAERIVMETMKALLWWNPFVWIAARRLTEVEEYEADHDVLQGGYDRDRYMEILFRQAFGHAPQIANTLRNSLTKKRFQMMTSNHTGRHALLRMAAMLPAIGALLCAFSFTTKAARIETASTKSPEQVIYLLNGREVPAAEIRAAEPDALTIESYYTQENLPAEYLDRNPLMVIAFKAEEPLKRYDPVRIEGTATYPDGRPAADIVVYAGAFGTQPIKPEVYPARTDAEGRFALTGPAHGSLAYAYATGDPFAGVHSYDNEGTDPYEVQLEVPFPDTTRWQMRVDATGRIAWEPREDATGQAAGIEEQPAPTQAPEGESEIRLDIVDREGHGIEGAAVVVVGTDRGVITDTEGSARLFVDPGATLRITHPGYRAEEIHTADHASAQIIMVPLKPEGATPEASAADAPRHAAAGEETDNDEPFLIAETMPLFRGGDITAFRQWVQTTVRYPAEAVREGVQGRVVLTFIIERDGSVSNIQVLQSPDERLAKEACRAVADATGWSAGLQQGKPVRVRYTLPVDFRLGANNSDNAPATPQPSATPSADPDSPDNPRMLAAEMPQFEGGTLNDFRRWVQMRVRYPEEALRQQLYGRVVASFVIGRDGSVGDIRILASPCKELSDEVVRVLSASPRWEPGREKGQTVAVKYVLPVEFAVSTDKEMLRESPESKVQGDIDEIVVVGYGPRKQ